MFPSLLNDIYSMVQSAMNTMANLALSNFGTDLSALNNNLPRLKSFTSVMKSIGIRFSILLFLLSMLAFFIGILSEKSESPVHILLRFVLTVAFVSYAIPLSEKMLNLTSNMQQIIDLGNATSPNVAFGTIVSNAGLSAGTNPHIFLMLILLCVFDFFFIKLLLQLIERYIYLGIYVYTSPLFIAMFASKETQNAAEKWLGLFFGQNILVLLTTWAVKVVILSTASEINTFIGFIFVIAMMSATAHISDLLNIFGVHIPQQRLDHSFKEAAGIVRTAVSPIAKEGSQMLQRAVLGSDNTILGRNNGGGSAPTGNIVGNAVRNTRNGFDLAGNSSEVKNDTRVVKTESGGFALRPLNTNVQDTKINTSQNAVAQQVSNKDGSVSIKTDSYSPVSTSSSSTSDVNSTSFANTATTVNTEAHVSNIGRPIERPTLDKADAGRVKLAGLTGTSAQGNQTRGSGSIFKVIENTQAVNRAIRNSDDVVNQRIEKANDINNSIGKVNEAMSKGSTTVSASDVSKALGISQDTGLELKGQFMHSNNNDGFIYGMATVTDRFGNSSDRMVALSFNPDQMLPEYYNQDTYKTVGETGVRVYTASLDNAIKNDEIKTQLEIDRDEIIRENKRFEEDQRRKQNEEIYGA